MTAFNSTVSLFSSLTIVLWYEQLPPIHLYGLQILPKIQLMRSTLSFIVETTTFLNICLKASATPIGLKPRFLYRKTG